jgi:hypothetical protein
VLGQAARRKDARHSKHNGQQRPEEFHVPSRHLAKARQKDDKQKTRALLNTLPVVVEHLAMLGQGVSRPVGDVGIIAAGGGKGDDTKGQKYGCGNDAKALAHARQRDGTTVRKSLLGQHITQARTEKTKLKGSPEMEGPPDLRPGES